MNTISIYVQNNNIQNHTSVNNVYKFLPIPYDVINIVRSFLLPCPWGSVYKNLCSLECKHEYTDNPLAPLAHMFLLEEKQEKKNLEKMCVHCTFLKYLKFE